MPIREARRVLIVFYGLAVLARAALLRLSGLVAVEELLRAAARCTGTLWLAWGLISGRTWAPTTLDERRRPR
jgi:hypothetical protein